MKKIAYLLLIQIALGISPSLTFAQTWQWAIKDSDENGPHSSGSAICVDSAGNSYITGELMGSTYFNTCGTISNPGSQYIFVSKYNSSGTCQWVKTAGAYPSSGASGTAIAVDKYGNLLVSGLFTDSASFGSIHLSGTSNLFIAKYANNGNILWAKGCPGSTGLGGISVDKKCHVYITGNGSGNLSGCALSGGFFLEKLDSNGNCIWAKGDPRPRPLNGGGLVKTDSVENIYLCGDYGDTLTLGAYTLYPPIIHGHEYTFIAKFDSSGTCLWAKGGYPAGLTGMGIDRLDNVYVTGEVGGSTVKMDFGCDTLTVNPNSSFMVKLNSSGNCVWNEPINASCSGLHTKQNGTSDLVCSFNTSASIGSCNFSGGPGIFINGLDSAGNCDWSQTAGFCEPWGGIDCDYSGNCYISGGISANTTFGSITLTNPSSTQSILVAKLNVPVGTGTGHSPTNSSSTFNIYPNPSAGGYNMDISPNLLNSQLNIYDVQGRVVFQTTISQQNPQINIPSLAKGMYYVQLITPQGGTLEKTIVKQ